MPHTRLQCAAMALCPESPAWLARAGRPSDAVRSLRRLHGTAFHIQDYPKLQQAYIVLDGEEADGQGAGSAASPTGAALQHPLLDSEQGGSGGEGGGNGQPEGAHLGWSALWEPRYRRVMILAVAMPLAQQASGGCTGVRRQGGCWARALLHLGQCRRGSSPAAPMPPHASACWTRFAAGINTVIFYSSQVRPFH